jgi:hypothetical protein
LVRAVSVRWFELAADSKSITLHYVPLSAQSALDAAHNGIHVTHATGKPHVPTQTWPFGSTEFLDLLSIAQCRSRVTKNHRCVPQSSVPARFLRKPSFGTNIEPVTMTAFTSGLLKTETQDVDRWHATA